jgi:hypothetical protein
MFSLVKTFDLIKNVKLTSVITINLLERIWSISEDLVLWVLQNDIPCIERTILDLISGSLRGVFKVCFL